MSCSSSCLQPSISGKGVSPSAMPKKISQQHVGSLETEDLVEEILFSTAKWRVLIIACDAYATQPLSKCKEAAEVIRKEIERCWPNTTEIGLVLDPGPDALRDACEEFVRRPTVNQRLFLYFAGHGFEKDGQNYMVPVLPGPSVCLQHLRWKLEKGCILFAAMDCCRVHDPFYPDEPLEVLTEPYRYTKPLKTDYMYLFSCLSGEQRRDDIEFAEALKPCFSKPELKLSEVQQIVKDAMPKHRCDSTEDIQFFFRRCWVETLRFYTIGCSSQQQSKMQNCICCTGLLAFFFWPQSWMSVFYVLLPWVSSVFSAALA